VLPAAKAYIADDLDWPIDRVTATVTEMVSKRFIEYDEAHCWVWLPNYFEHNPIENPNVGKKRRRHSRDDPEDIPTFRLRYQEPGRPPRPPPRSVSQTARKTISKRFRNRFET